MSVPTSVLQGCVRVVSASEGGYSSVNANTDGQGVSWGIIQWTQKSGNLGVALEACLRADPRGFASVMGAAGHELVTQLRSSEESVRMAPVAGVPLWSEPWVSRLRDLGKLTTIRAEQLALASHGAHMQKALAAWKTVGPPSQRMLALVYDTAVNQGSGALQTVVSRFKAAWTSSQPYARVIDLWCLSAASRYRSSTPVEGWQASTDGYWYKVRHGRRTYDVILARQRAIAANPSLSDTVLS